MPQTRECDYCGGDIEPGTGTMYVQVNGAVTHFCSSKCEHNAELGREARDLEWTEAGRGAKGPAADETDSRAGIEQTDVEGTAEEADQQTAEGTDEGTPEATDGLETEDDEIEPSAAAGATAESASEAAQPVDEEREAESGEAAESEADATDEPAPDETASTAPEPPDDAETPGKLDAAEAPTDEEQTEE